MDDVYSSSPSGISNSSGETSRAEASLRRVRAVTFRGSVAFSIRLIVSGAIPD
jgi:hypothetical protein